MDDVHIEGLDNFNFPAALDITAKDNGGLYINLEGKEVHLTDEQLDLIQAEINKSNRRSGRG